MSGAVAPDCLSVSSSLAATCMFVIYLVMRHGKANNHFLCEMEFHGLQAVKEGEVWYCSPDCLRVSSSLAATCMRGVMACPPAEDGTPVGWQLIRGASVASPKV